MNAIDEQGDPHEPQSTDAELAAGFQALLTNVSTLSLQHYEELRREAERAQVFYDDRHGLSQPFGPERRLSTQRSLFRPQAIRRALAVAAAGSLLLVALGWGVGQVHQPLPSRPGTSSSPPTPGIILVGYSKVTDVPHAATVASMFTHYFSAINKGEYDAALEFFDPNTLMVDLNSPASREKWKEGMAGVHYDDVAVDLDALTTSGAHTFARVHFRSTRPSGYGPVGIPNLTCTNWNVTYQLTHDNGVYRILKGAASAAECTTSG